MEIGWVNHLRADASLPADVVPACLRRCCASSMLPLSASPIPACRFPLWPRRFERWIDAALQRPSAQQTKPTDDVIVEGMRKFVAPFKG